jgi:hypothetical protein
VRPLLLGALGRRGRHLGWDTFQHSHALSLQSVAELSPDICSATITA